MAPKRKKVKRRKRSSVIRYISRLKGIVRKDAREFSGLYEISRSLTSAIDLRKILDMVTFRVSELMKASVCTLRLLEGQDAKRLVLRSAYGLDGKNLELKKDIRMDEAYAVVKVVKDSAPVIVNDLLTDTKYEHKPFDQHRKKLRSLISVPLAEKNRVVGVLSIYNKKAAYYKGSDTKTLLLFASLAAIAIENARLFEKTRSNYINTMRFFASVIDVKDKYTGGHSDRVMRHMLQLADRLGLTSREKEILRYASLLHDIGKISIDPSILSKPGPLTEDEWEQIKKHPVIGANIIKKIGFLDDIIPVVLYHHERYGGGGYPQGTMKSKQIPLMARVMAVVDAYEAMTSDRPYRKALTTEQAVDEIKRNSGTQFDPKIARLFIAILRGSERQNNNHKKKSNNKTPAFK